MCNAVLVIDMLKGFLEDGHNLYCGDHARRVIPKIRKLLEDEIALGSKVFYICDNHEPDDLEFDMFPVHCLIGSEESEIIPELLDFPGERINKHRYSGFYNSSLQKQLESLDPDKVIICGVCTDICVMHTVADARNRDYNVEIHVDTVSTFDMDAHKWALRHMEKVLGARLIGQHSG